MTFLSSPILQQVLVFWKVVVQLGNDGATRRRLEVTVFVMIHPAGDPGLAFFHVEPLGDDPSGIGSRSGSWNLLGIHVDLSMTS